MVEAPPQPQPARDWTGRWVLGVVVVAELRSIGESRNRRGGMEGGDRWRRATLKGEVGLISYLPRELRVRGGVD